MSDIDVLPFDYPLEERPALAKARVCRHPREYRRALETGDVACERCGRTISRVAILRGRNNRKRGNKKELQAAVRDGTKREGQYGGKVDYRTELFVVQNKSMSTARFPGWMSDILATLRPLASSAEPVLHIEESPGSGRRGRELYVCDGPTWRALHGEQV